MGQNSKVSATTFITEIAQEVLTIGDFDKHKVMHVPTNEVIEKFGITIRLTFEEQQ